MNLLPEIGKIFRSLLLRYHRRLRPPGRDPDPPGEVALTRYQFNTRTATHFFCSHCGIHTHHQRRSNPSQYGFNVACLEGVDPFALQDVPTRDGIHHPADREES